MPWRKTEPMEQRIEFALKAMQTLNFRVLCQEYGISTKTGYKWKERFMREGLEGMGEESRRPKSHAAQLQEEEVCEIVRLKLAHMSWGPRKIRELYLRRHRGVASESTFKRVLERAGLTQKRRRRCCAEAGRLSSGRRASAPNEIWTVDLKGWWRSYGKRCEPLTVRDEHSRYVLELRVMQNARTETVRQRFERLFERAGLPQAMRSDNGSPFASINALFGLSRLSAWWVALGIDLERGRPGHPQDNGAHERLHRAGRLKPWGNPIRGASICGGKHLTTSGRTKPLGCVVQGSSIALRSENMKAHLMNCTIHKCALDELAPKEQSKSITNTFSSVPRWPDGMLASNPWPKTDWKFGLVACSWARWIFRSDNFFGPISARKSQQTYQKHQRKTTKVLPMF